MILTGRIMPLKRLEPKWQRAFCQFNMLAPFSSISNSRKLALFLVELKPLQLGLATMQRPRRSVVASFCIALLSIGALLSMSIVATAVAQETTSKTMPRNTPESQGVSSAAILDFIRTADREVKSMHSFMLVCNGNVIAEAWWKPESADKAACAVVTEQELYIDRRWIGCG